MNAYRTVAIGDAVIDRSLVTVKAEDPAALKLYLAGPMRGKPYFNFPAFREARESLRAAGYVVSCPAERDALAGFEPDPAGLSLDGWNAREALTWDASQVLAADAIALLDGWQASQGAGWEVTAAQMAGIPVYAASELIAAHAEHREPSPLRLNGDPRFLRALREMGWLHQKKGADYGRTGDSFANVRAAQQWGVPAWVGAMVRANDKIVRLQAAAFGSKLQNEGVEDSLIDLACYAVIALILFREQSETR